MVSTSPACPSFFRRARVLAPLCVAAFVLGPSTAQAADPPLVCSAELTTHRDADGRFAAEGGDAEHGRLSCHGGARGGGDITISVLTAPAHGNVSGFTPNPLDEFREATFTYTPNTGYTGQDGFVLRANHGTEHADFQLLVRDGPAVNDPPECSASVGDVEFGNPPHRVEAGENEPGSIFCSDDEGQNVTVTTLSPPAHGALSPLSGGPNGYEFTYTGTGAYRGADSFTLRATDGTNPVDVAVPLDVIAPQNKAPRCFAELAQDENTTQLPGGKYSLLPGFAHDGFFSCNDDQGEGNTLVLSADDPAHGAVTFNQAPQSDAFRSASFTYTPDTGYSGDDAIVLHATDGTNPVQQTISVHVNGGANDPPVCGASVLDFESQGGPETVQAGVHYQGTLGCVDQENDPITASVITNPVHGTLANLSGSGGFFQFDYTPDSAYRGADSLKLRGTATGGTSDAEVLLQVVDPPADGDGDGVSDDTDNCPEVANASQADNDGTGGGDACDIDDDNDTLADSADPCPIQAATNLTGCPTGGGGGGGGGGGAAGGGSTGGGGATGGGDNAGALATLTKGGAAKTTASGNAITVDTGIAATCPAGAGPCTGSDQITTKQAGSSRVAAAKKKKKKKAKTVVLGKGSFTIAAGQQLKIKIKLSAKGAKLLRKKKKLKVTILVTVKTAAGKVTPLTKTVTLKAPKTKGKKKKR